MKGVKGNRIVKYFTSRVTEQAGQIGVFPGNLGRSKDVQAFYFNGKITQLSLK